MLRTLLTYLRDYVKDPDAAKHHAASLVAVVVAVIGIVHPGFREPSWVPAALGAVGSAGAVLAQVLNMLRRHKVKAAK